MVHALPQFGAAHYQQLLARQDNVSPKWSYGLFPAKVTRTSHITIFDRVTRTKSKALAYASNEIRRRIRYFAAQNEGFRSCDFDDATVRRLPCSKRRTVPPPRH
jgi:hypothetical protein